MKHLFILLITLCCFACKEPQARKPVSVKSGSFLKESVDRTKKRLEAENNFIKEYIQKDTLNTYLNSEKGFWYTYIKQDTLNTPKPVFGNKVTYNYSISNFSNAFIYTKEEIGTQTYFVDQENLLEGLRQGIKLMKEGEEIKFIFPSQLAYGYKGDRNKIKPNTPVICNITLNQIEIKTDK